MTAADCSGSEAPDFRRSLEVDGRQQRPADLDPDDDCTFYGLDVGQPQFEVPQSVQILAHSLQTHSPSQLQAYKPSDLGLEPQGPWHGPAMGPPAFQCPSIHITSISPGQQDMEADVAGLWAAESEGMSGELLQPRRHLFLPLDPAYRDPSRSPSPCSSLSSRSWVSEASSCESFSQWYDDIEAELNEAAARFTLSSPVTSPTEETRPQRRLQQCPAAVSSHTSPRQSLCPSPRTSVTEETGLSLRSPSSPASPYGKRRHSNADTCVPGPALLRRSPAPGNAPRGSLWEETWANCPSDAPPLQYCPTRLDIPSKTRKTSQDLVLPGKGGVSLEDLGGVSPSQETPSEDQGHGAKKDEQILPVPSHFTWDQPKPGDCPIFRSSSLPPLDWPLPSHFGQYELKIEEHPRAHHRAHYETEGSRGAVKAVSGGHPVVKLIGYSEKLVPLQVFIGTADERSLRPHPFYKVHRITGKTVATPSQETTITGTKVLEIPLLPENNMTASLDCAGILKLRNSDIEQQKGEADVGRKNTRVRMVFRVHIPQRRETALSLQTTSGPVECSQRCAPELPQVHQYSPASCPVAGGAEMRILGSHFCSESKVVFWEKGSDERLQWKVDAKVLRDKSQGTNIVVEVPPYHSETVTATAVVQFCVCNGKSKRSQGQRFTFLSGLLKPEWTDEQDDPAMTSPEPQAPLLSQQDPHLLPGRIQHTLLPGTIRGSGPSRTPPLPAYSSSTSSSFQHRPCCQGNSLSSEFQLMSPTPAPPPPLLSAGPSYQPLLPSLGFDGQPRLPMSTGSSPAHQLPLQPDPPAADPLQLSMGSHPPNFPMFNDWPPPSHAGQSMHSRTHPRPHPQGFHCPDTQQDPSTPNPLTLRLPQLHCTLGYHSPAPSPSPNNSPIPIGQSTSSGPASPCRSPPTDSTLSPILTPSSPLTQQPSPQTARGPTGPLLAPLSPFAFKGEGGDLKREPEATEPTFCSIGLQDITLDDVTEIIGRDMPRAPGPQS